MAAGAEIVTVKGTVIKSLMKFVSTELTPAQLESCLAQLPADFSGQIRGQVLMTATFPVTQVNRFTELCAAAKGEPAESFAKRAGRASADDAVKTVYRLLVMVLTPTALLQKATSMWRTIYSAGEYSVEAKRPGLAHIFLRNFPSEPVGCARVSGWIEQLGSMTKVKNLAVRHIKCIAKKDPHCEWTVSWGE
jgi:hypothetical protein